MEAIKKNEDFRSVYSLGKSFANDYFVMYTVNNGMESNRFGISVSKKVGNSCIRHKLKRQIKEIIRLNEEKFIKGNDIVFIVRKKAKNAEFDVIKSKILFLSQKIKVSTGTNEQD